MPQTKAGTSNNQKKCRNTVKSDSDVSATSASAAHNEGNTSTESTSVDMSNNHKCAIVINELLSYATFYRDRATADNLRKLTIGFYGASEISAAKRQLINCFSSSLSDCPYKAERRKSSSRSVSEAKTDDILGLLSYLDNKSLLTDIKFAAIDHDRLPKYGPEELNICCIADKQQELSGTLVDLTSRVDRIDTSVVDTLQQTVRSVQAQVNELSETTKLLSAMSSSSSNGSANNLPHSSSLSRHVDRSHNVIISGIEENRDHTVWRDTVSAVLRTAAGRDIHVEDAFRLGAYHSGKKRPVLIKLRSIWDRRLVLSGARNLNNDVLFRRKVFINADESPEERRRNALQRIRRRAESMGQQVHVSSDGVLSIDNVVCFSVRDGYLNRDVLVNSRESVNVTNDMAGSVTSPHNG